MNLNGKSLNMKNSHYSNTNGLGNSENVSSVTDVAIISIEMMENLFVH